MAKDVATHLIKEALVARVEDHDDIAIEAQDRTKLKLAVEPEELDARVGDPEDILDADDSKAARGACPSGPPGFERSAGRSCKGPALRSGGLFGQPLAMPSEVVLQAGHESGRAFQAVDRRAEPLERFSLRTQAIH